MYDYGDELDDEEDYCRVTLPEIARMFAVMLVPAVVLFAGIVGVLLWR